MIDLCRPFLNFDKNYFQGIVTLDRDPAKWHMDHGDKEGHGKNAFDMKYDGWGRGMCYDSYGQGETWSWKYRTPGVPGADDDGVTNETIHASARERWTSSRVTGLKTGPPVWDPHALKGFKPKSTGTGTGVLWQWVKEEGHVLRKGLEIPEAPFPIETHFPTISGLPVPSFESMLRDGITK